MNIRRFFYSIGSVLNTSTAHNPHHIHIIHIASSVSQSVKQSKLRILSQFKSLLPFITALILHQLQFAQPLALTTTSSSVLISCSAQSVKHFRLLSLKERLKRAFPHTPKFTRKCAKQMPQFVGSVNKHTLTI